MKYEGPTDEDLAFRVEYDMDEQDKAWVDEENLRLASMDLPKVEFDLFEEVMDRIEKEWFDYTRSLPAEVIDSSEDNKCAVCGEEECENSNVLVFCDGCDIAVHQDCYGIPYIPEGQWLCRKCIISPDRPVRCIFCPIKGGAFKQTDTNQWVHLLCALCIPECTIKNYVFMEPVSNIKNIPRSRWKLQCYLCRRRQGAPIQCSNKNCYTSFHVSCTRKVGLYMQMRGRVDQADNCFKIYCHKHTPKEQRLKYDVYNFVAVYQSAWSHINLNGLSMHRGDKHFNEELYTHFDSGKPRANQKKLHVLPESVFERICLNIQKSKQASREFILNVCRYWSLKREAGGDAPLLRRLYLEPWTANILADRKSEELKAKRLSKTLILRSALEKARILVRFTIDREECKLSVINSQIELFKELLAPVTSIVSPCFEVIKKFDKNNFFKSPIRQEDVPDYYTYIKNPMDFLTLENKLKSFEYEYEYNKYERDLDLIWTNCMFYNKSETQYWSSAHRHRARVVRYLIPLRRDILKGRLIKSDQWEALLKINASNVKHSPAVTSEILKSEHECLKSENISNGHMILTFVNRKVMDTMYSRQFSAEIKDIFCRSSLESEYAHVFEPCAESPRSSSELESIFLPRRKRRLIRFYEKGSHKKAN